MSRTRYLVFGGIFSLLLSAVVIVAANYYESPSLLVGQVVAIAGPTAVPFAIVATRRPPKLAMAISVALLLSAAWGYVVFVDTRPYHGGGASFAMLFGWFGCVLAAVFAIIAIFAADARR